MGEPAPRDPTQRRSRREQQVQMPTTPVRSGRQAGRINTAPRRLGTAEATTGRQSERGVAQAAVPWAASGSAVAGRAGFGKAGRRNSGALNGFQVPSG